jgi:hypothetical protein
MKKLILLAAFAFGAVVFNDAQAQQISDNALGLRIGGGGGYGAEVSYQRATGGDNNRLEFDLGWRDSNDYDAIKIVGLYQWIWNIEGGFNWYAGAGGGLGNIEIKDHNSPNDDGVFLLVAGDIGIEYNFDFPLLLSLDFRPEISLFNGYEDLDDFTPDIALGIRYQF